jgi:hypothetical protein
MKFPYFLNVDLDIESKSPLRSLRLELSDKVSVTFSGRIKSHHCLDLEIVGGGKSQDSIVNAFCALIEGLSASGKRAWESAIKREFDFGYETRLSSQRANRFSIRPNTLHRVAKLGATVAVTIYPERVLQKRSQRTP